MYRKPARASSAYTRTDNHTLVTIPAALLREVFGNDDARTLLLHITQLDKPVRYSEARERLGLHPQEFQRALDRLEDYGLVGLRAPADLNKPHAKRDYYVFLEPTVLGSFAASLWERMNANFAQLAKEHNIPEDALLAAAGSE